MDTQDLTAYADEIERNTILEEEIMQDDTAECCDQKAEKRCTTVEDHLEEVHKIMEDSNTSAEERVLAIGRFEDKIQKLIEMKNYYATRLAEIIQDYNMTTCSKGKQQKTPPQDTTEGVYSKYDRTYKAE